MDIQERKSNLITVVPIFLLLLGVMALGNFDEGTVSDSKTSIATAHKGASLAGVSAPALVVLDPGHFLVIRDPSIGEGEKLRIAFRGDEGFAVEVKPDIVREGLAIVQVPIYTNPATGKASEGTVWVYLKESRSEKPVHINRLSTM